MDLDFVSTYLGIDPALRRPHDGREKYLLRKAFADKGYIPEEVLRRKKEAFSDGVSTEEDSRFGIIHRFIESLVSDEDLALAVEKFPHCPPQTKEQYRYRSRFEHHFGPQHTQVIPYYRMPKRVSETIDPSARMLEVYHKKTIQG